MNNTLPGVSVLLPVYMKTVSIDEVALLRDAIESIVEQGYAGELEILLIDDGSPLPIRTLESEIGPAASMVRWIRLNQNRGIVFALNEGLKHSRYELIGRIDADDCWLPNKLKEQLELFANDPDLSITATGMTRVNKDGIAIDNHVRPGDWEGILNFFVDGGCPFPHGSVLARRSVYKILGGYPNAADVRHCEDYALWGTWLRFFKPAMVERALYQYRVSKASVSSQHQTAQATASQMVRKRFEVLGLGRVLPQALENLAEILDCSVMEAGILSYKMWSFGASLTLPEAAIEPLSLILPDRIIGRSDTAVCWRSILGRQEFSDESSGIGLSARAYR